MATAVFQTIRSSIRTATKQSKVAGIIWFIQSFYDMEPYHEKMRKLEAMPVGSIGRAIAIILKTNGLRLIPKFENHDVKHVLLGYDMTAEDEVRMQAFLLGNGNRSLPCLLFLSFGLIMPELWGDFKKHYEKGKMVKPISHFTLNEIAPYNLGTVTK